ncbi:hypothetical protein GWK47_019496 [Chionoecetes opilio]|uniref:Uncharacterized protein n=1 Tax=Chionoecetes opilio TaxID=41210 RepID=A0A8J5BX81_CHIOP|nr:hypothetical protein GWK47_019496 [Chionoecetes opilio]
MPSLNAVDGGALSEVLQAFFKRFASLENTVKLLMETKTNAEKMQSECGVRSADSSMLGEASVRGKAHSAVGTECSVGNEARSATGVVTNVICDNSNVIGNECSVRGEVRSVEGKERGVSGGENRVLSKECSVSSVRAEENMVATQCTVQIKGKEKTLHSHMLMAHGIDNVKGFLEKCKDSDDGKEKIIKG